MTKAKEPKGQHGGARPGTGPKPKEPAKLPPTPGMDPIEFLLSVQNDGAADPALRLRAATAAARLMGPRGKGKGSRGDDAGSKYEPSAPPKLVVNNR